MPAAPPSDSRRSRVWRLKERLQFTGWLQYLINAVAAFACLLVAALAWVIAPSVGLASRGWSGAAPARPSCLATTSAGWPGPDGRSVLSDPM